MSETKKHIPHGWDSQPIGALVTEQLKSTIKVSEASGFGAYPFFTSGDDILVHSQPLIDGKTIFLATGGQANVKYYDGDAAYSTDTYALKSNGQIAAKLLFYDLDTMASYIDGHYFQGSGLKHLQKKDLKRHELCFPKDKKEQQRIVRLLTCLDEAIAKTEALIEKYRRIKQGMMHDLLTCGIDKDGNIRSPKTHRFKPSPLGMIPEEWTVETLNRIATNIEDCPHTTPLYRDSGILVARTFCIKDGRYLDSISSYVSEQEYNERVSRLIPEEGDIIFTREAPIGEAFVIPKRMKICLGQRVMIIRTNRKFLIPSFFVLFNYSFRMQQFYKSITGGTTVNHLNVADVKELRIPLPTIKEQREICKKIDALNPLMEKEFILFNKLQLQRKGLLNDLLTGKVRIPETVSI